ncbi:MAG: hypothetical protein P8Z39_01980 [Gammaproteobacteria bacterium]
MANVTVKIVGGSEKENLTAITVGYKRWGVNGEEWGSTQSVPSGDNTPIGSYYSGKRSSAGSFDLEDGGVTLEITANGPGETEVDIVNG